MLTRSRYALSSLALWTLGIVLVLAIFLSNLGFEGPIDSLEFLSPTYTLRLPPRWSAVQDVIDRNHYLADLVDQIVTGESAF